MGVGHPLEVQTTLTRQSGWIRELIGRLTDSEPQSGPTINSTLDTDPATFPRGGKRVFAVSYLPQVLTIRADEQDFTHDNEMIQILTAMRLLTVCYVPSRNLADNIATRPATFGQGPGQTIIHSL